MPRPPRIPAYLPPAAAAPAGVPGAAAPGTPPVAAPPPPAPPPLTLPPPPPAIPCVSAWDRAKGVLGWILLIIVGILLLIFGFALIRLAWNSTMTTTTSATPAPAAVATTTKLIPESVPAARPIVQAIPIPEDPVVPQGNRQVVFNEPPRDFNITSRRNNRTGEIVPFDGGKLSPAELEKLKKSGKWYWEKEKYFDPEGKEMPGPNRR